jgi:DnaK suppressor protein
MSKRKQMDKKTLKEFEQMLLGRRQEIAKSLTSGLEELTGSETVMSDDIGEGAKNAEEADVACLLAEAGSKELGEIDEALVRIKAGTFGMCEDCEDAIPFARLEAIPNASLCLHCKQEAEKNQSYGQVRRRRSEEDLDD